MDSLDDVMDASPAGEELTPISLCKPQLQEHPRSSLSVVCSMVLDQLLWLLARGGEKLELQSSEVSGERFSGKRAISECLFSSGGCGGRTDLELCALDLALTGSQFPMLGGSPRCPQREHPDRYLKPEKNDSVECHDTEKVLEPPMVQNRDLPCLMVGN